MRARCGLEDCDCEYTISMLLKVLKEVLPYAEAYDPAEYGGEEPTQREDIDFAYAIINKIEGEKHG